MPRAARTETLRVRQRGDAPREAAVDEESPKAGQELAQTEHTEKSTANCNGRDNSNWTCSKKSVSPACGGIRGTLPTSGGAHPARQKSFPQSDPLIGRAQRREESRAQGFAMVRRSQRDQEWVPGEQGFAMVRRAQRLQDWVVPGEAAEPNHRGTHLDAKHARQGV